MHLLYYLNINRNTCSLCPQCPQFLNKDVLSKYYRYYAESVTSCFIMTSSVVFLLKLTFHSPFCFSPLFRFCYGSSQRTLAVWFSKDSSYLLLT